MTKMLLNLLTVQSSRYLQTSPIFYLGKLHHQLHVVPVLLDQRLGQLPQVLLQALVTRVLKCNVI